MKRSRALERIPVVVEPCEVQDSLLDLAPACLTEEERPTLAQLTKLRLGREPVLVAWGAGRDSTAMIIELLARGEPIDWVLFADTGAEKPQSYVFVVIFMQWLREHGVPCSIVCNVTRNFKHWPRYTTLEENCLTNATFPSSASHAHSEQE